VSRIALDGMGGDFAPQSNVEGAVRAARRGLEVLLVGDEAQLRPRLEEAHASDGVRVVHAPDAIGMSEHSARETRNRRQSSIYVGIDLLKRGEADAFVSMGNTGAVLAVAFFALGRLPGVDRPALGGLLPTERGQTLLLDVGANADARPPHLVEFARLGSAYMRRATQVPEPGVALLNIGEEPSKGSTLTVEAHALLAARSDIRFLGNIESRELLSGDADVIVTDGFTGNVALKLMEGTASLLFSELRRAARRSPLAAAGALLLRGSLEGLRDRVDYRRRGGAPLLGVNGIVMVGHGRSDGAAVESALVAASSAADAGILAALREAVAEV